MDMLFNINTYYIFKFYSFCRMNDSRINLRMALHELREDAGSGLIGCGFGDKNGLTLLKEGEITR